MQQSFSLDLVISLGHILYDRLFPNEKILEEQLLKSILNFWNTQIVKHSW